MKSRRDKRQPQPILAAGGIVVTAGHPPLLAVVQRRKDDGWVLPKGKLKPRESIAAAAMREAAEETGHKVVPHDYLGVVSYPSNGRPKIVHFWRMTSIGSRREPMSDIKAVKWLPLPEALARLSQPIERAFLAQVSAAPQMRRAHATPVPPRPSGKKRRLRKTPVEPAPVAADPVGGERPAVVAPTLLRRLLSRLHDSGPS